MYHFSVTTSHTRGRPSTSPSPRDLPSLAYPLETHLHIRPTRSYIDVLASTTPTTQYRTVPHSSLTSLCLRDLPGPPRNPLKGHHLVVPTTTRSFPSSVAVLVAPFELQPAPSTLQHKPPYTKTYPKTYFDPGLAELHAYDKFSGPLLVASVTAALTWLLLALSFSTLDLWGLAA
ncbi:hypothetical protein F5877DRAFT_80570 [Lentinula edodes]|nr:hypothetical protein F5877DRAFT_80570 [Lentinula edodes]